MGLQRPLAMTQQSTNRERLAGVSLALAVLLAGCSANLDELVVAPGKFEIYNCDQLAARGRAAVVRERELKTLIDRAEAGGGGALVSTIAYRNDYLTVRGELKQLEATAVDKKCEVSWKSVSERSMW
jgi:hypothetical protein